MAEDESHELVGEAEGGDVCSCGWWGPSQAEHQCVLAEQAQGPPNAPKAPRR